MCCGKQCLIYSVRQCHTMMRCVRRSVRRFVRRCQTGTIYILWHREVNCRHVAPLEQSSHLVSCLQSSRLQFNIPHFISHVAPLGHSSRIDLYLLGTAALLLTHLQLEPWCCLKPGVFVNITSGSLVYLLSFSLRISRRPLCQSISMAHVEMSMLPAATHGGARQCQAVSDSVSQERFVLSGMPAGMHGSAKHKTAGGGWTTC
jgi:hypothetical protein